MRMYPLKTYRTPRELNLMIKACGEISDVMLEEERFANRSEP